MVQNFHLQNFMAQMDDGARPNQFYVDISLPQALIGQIPNGVQAENQIKFLVKATNIPAMNTGQASVYFRGAEFKLAGDKSFDDWTVTVVNKSSFLIRDAFERWSDMILGNVDRDSAVEDDPTQYMSNGTITQLSRNSKPLKTYNVVGIWPSNVGEISLDMSQNDSIEEFTCTFKVQWWESSTTRNNSAGDLFGSLNGGQQVI